MKRFFLLMLSLATVASTTLAGPPIPPPRTYDSAPANNDGEKVIPVPGVSSESKPQTPIPSHDPYNPGSGRDIFGPRLGFESIPRWNVVIRLTGTSFEPVFLIDYNNGICVSYVEMENLTTGETAGLYRAQTGTVRIPVSSAMGNWWVVVKAASGEYYSGTFCVDASWRL